MSDWSFLYLVSEWAIRIVMLIYVPQHRSAAASRTWLLLIFLLPWPGLILYALFGRIYLPARRIAMQERASRSIRLVQSQIDAGFTIQPRLPANLQPIPAEANRLGDFEAVAGNEIRLLTDYQGAVQALLDDISAARNHVHLLSYIYGADQIGRRVLTALREAAARGVRCRVLLDAFGSKKALRQLGPVMRESGIEVIELLPVGPFRKNAARFDLRNHRKIAVIDGRIGHTGSQNIVDPCFVPGYTNEELLVRVRGPIVAQLQAVFLADYYLETSKTCDENDLFPKAEPAGDAVAQVVPSGPGYGRENGRDLIVSMLYMARKEATITTPYFVPDEPFLHAIQAATAHGGLKVRLVLSRHANQLITQFAQRSFYDDLLAAGAEIYLYRPRFLHAKHITIDDDIALVGSTNMDIRSFALNAEINLLVYDRKIVDRLRDLQQSYFAHSDRLTIAEWQKRSLGARVLQNTARLMDSFL